MFGYCSMDKLFKQMNPTSAMTTAIEIAITFLVIKMFSFIE